MNPWRALGVVLTVASAVDAAVLTTTVDGYAITPELRFWLTIAQAGVAAALLVLPGLMRDGEVHTQDGTLDLQKPRGEHAP